MDFEYNDKTLEYKEKLEGFMEENVYPADRGASRICGRSFESMAAASDR